MSELFEPVSGVSTVGFCQFAPETLPFFKSVYGLRSPE